MKAFTASLSTDCMVIVAVDTAVLASVVGVYMIFCYLAFTTLPAIGYALAFNRNPEE